MRGFAIFKKSNEGKGVEEEEEEGVEGEISRFEINVGPNTGASVPCFLTSHSECDVWNVKKYGAALRCADDILL
ncbi:hypothetical protein M0802_009928 [Mischocyttarus mexicanus]|nr:hypothetical protein M0802_009928 [Mischocyttarus mexicanus]